VLWDANEDSRLASSIREIFASLGHSVCLLSERTALDQSLSERNSEICAIRSELTQRDAKVRSLDSTLSARNSELDAIRIALTQRDAKVRSLDSTLSARNSELDVIRSELTQRDAKVRSLDSTLSARNSALDPIRSELTQRDAKVRSLESTLSALYASASWRVTLPLRSMKKVLGRLRYISLGSAAALAVQVLRRRSLAPLREWPMMLAVAGSGLFDREWYLKKNPDVARSGIDPVRH